MADNTGATVKENSIPAVKESSISDVNVNDIPTAVKEDSIPADEPTVTKGNGDNGRDPSEMYTDETQELVRSMQESADRMTEAYHDNPYDVRDIIKDIIFFFITVIGAFGWLMIMLLIISFVSLSYLHLKIDKMIIASVVFAIGIGVFYIIMKSKKYVRLNDEKRRRREEKRREQLSGDPEESFLFKNKEGK